jgi:spectinomycin phosphotransferase
MTRQLWANLDEYKMILYPYIEGKDDYEIVLSDQQWFGFGEMLSLIHSTQVPPDFAWLIPREDFTSYWREMVKIFQQ